jgi:NADH:ubiquinone oxidoreductase subunit K
MSFFIISIVIFITGFINCVDIRHKNLITFLLATEVTFFGLDCFFIFISFALNIAEGVIYSFVLIFLTICESVIGLGLCIYVNKYNKNVNFFNKEIPNRLFLTEKNSNNIFGVVKNPIN